MYLCEYESTKTTSHGTELISRARQHTGFVWSARGLVAAQFPFDGSSLLSHQCLLPVTWRSWLLSSANKEKKLRDFATLIYFLFSRHPASLFTNPHVVHTAATWNTPLPSLRIGGSISPQVMWTCGFSPSGLSFLPSFSLWFLWLFSVPLRESGVVSEKQWHFIWAKGWPCSAFPKPPCAQTSKLQWPSSRQHFLPCVWAA